MYGLMWCSRCLSENDSPQPEVYGNGICVGSTVGPGVGSSSILTTSTRPRIVSTKVQVTVSPGLSVNAALRFVRSMVKPVRPCELTQPRDVGSHIGPGSPCWTEMALEANENVRLGGRSFAALPSSSRRKVYGPPGPWRVKEKSCGLSGRASCTMTTRPCLVLVKVQVTV